MRTRIWVNAPDEEEEEDEFTRKGVGGEVEDERSKPA